MDRKTTMSYRPDESFPALSNRKWTNPGVVDTTGGQGLPFVSQVNRIPNSHASFRRQLGNNLLSRVVTGRRLSLDYRPRPTSRPLFLGCCSTLWSQYLTVYSRPSVFRWPAPLTFCVNASQNSSSRNLR